MPARSGWSGWIDGERPLERRPQLALEPDQVGDVAGREPMPERGRFDAAVEGAAERHVERDEAVRRPDRDVPREHERRDVPEPDRLDPAVVVEPRRADQPPARHVDRDTDDAVRRHGRKPARVDRPRDQRDRAVAARGRVALVVEEHDAEVRPVVVGRRHERPVHVGVAARLVDQQPADVIEVVHRPAPALEDGPALEVGDAAGHDPERLAGRVVVDGPDRALERELSSVIGRAAPRAEP